jgi:ribosomal protein L35
MPKMKTKKIVSKRFTLTKTGKLMHGVQGARHLRRKKSGSNKRRQDKPIALKTKIHTKKIKTFIAVL